MGGLSDIDIGEVCFPIKLQLQELLAISVSLPLRLIKCVFFADVKLIKDTMHLMVLPLLRVDEALT